ncbi:hypothetical protein EVAR_33362_1 [Eumeta japonica]|uniref:RNA-directed DNA polymerase from transposon BS n=1 Tax=Eumeta variegata TaxID=151549 RepID=A0A4C1X418_EUMVA|nr:hypothetical protein EVAR_33362_1 [Eumeta japonica]
MAAPRAHQPAGRKPRASGGITRTGVPQGSTLSPMLSAYVNDILRPKTSVQLALFADDTVLDASERFFDIASSYPNPLLISAISYEPHPPLHFCRKPRNVLLDPPDLTVEMKKLIEINKTTTD